MYNQRNATSYILPTIAGLTVATLGALLWIKSGNGSVTNNKFTSTEMTTVQKQVNEKNFPTETFASFTTQPQQTNVPRHSNDNRTSERNFPTRIFRVKEDDDGPLRDVCLYEISDGIFCESLFRVEYTINKVYAVKNEAYRLFEQKFHRKVLNTYPILLWHTRGCGGYFASPYGYIAISPYGIESSAKKYAHEITHAEIFNKTGSSDVPSWLDEGFAAQFQDIEPPKQLDIKALFYSRYFGDFDSDLRIYSLNKYLINEFLVQHKDDDNFFDEFFNVQLSRKFSEEFVNHFFINRFLDYGGATALKSTLGTLGFSIRSPEVQEVLQCNVLNKKLINRIISEVENVE